VRLKPNFPHLLLHHGERQQAYDHVTALIVALKNLVVNKENNHGVVGHSGDE